MSKTKIPMKLSGLVGGAAAVATPDPRVLEHMGDLGSDSNAVEIPVALIDPSPYQPRLQINEEALQQLADSIRATVQNTAVIVRPKQGGRYELVSGERRWRAVQRLGLDTISAVIRRIDDRTAALLALIDNTAREDLAAYEMGKTFDRLLRERLVAHVAELTRFVGLSRAQVDRCLDYMKLPKRVTEWLDENPRLFGATTAEIFAQACADGHSRLVTQAAEMIRTGEQEKRAIAFLRDAIAGKSERPEQPSPTPLRARNQSIGEARVMKRKLTITCAPGVDPTRLLERFRAWLDSEQFTESVTQDLSP